MNRTSNFVTACLIAAGLGSSAYAGPNDLNWIGADDGVIAANPDNWLESRRPAEQDRLIFDDQGINGPSPCVFASEGAQDFIPRVQALTFREQAYMHLIGGLFEPDLPESPNLTTGAIESQGAAIIKKNLWLQTDDLVTTGTGMVSVEGRLDVMGVYRNWAYMVVQPDGHLRTYGDNTVLHGYNSVGGGKIDFSGDVALWHQPLESNSSLMVWDDFQSGAPGEVNVEGTLSLDNGAGSLTLLLNQSDLNVGGLDIRHAKSSYPDQAGRDLYLHSGNIRVNGGALQVPAGQPWSFGPSQDGGDDNRTLNMYLMDGAQFEHDELMTVNGGNQPSDAGCRGRFILSSTSDAARSSARIRNLTVGDSANEAGWVSVNGASDLDVLRIGVIGDSGIGGIRFDYADWQPGGPNPRPTGDFHDILYIGENGSPQAGLEISYGEVRAHDRVIMGRGDSSASLSVYSLGMPQPGASELSIGDDLEIGWDLWHARNHGPSTVVTFGGGAIDVGGRLGLGTTSDLYIGSESNVCCNGAMIRDAGNLSMMGGDFEVEGLVYMTGQSLDIPSRNDGSDPESEVRFDGASGDLANDFFVGHGGSGCRGTMTVTPGSNLDFDGLLTVGDGEAIGHVDFQTAATVRMNRQEAVMMGDGSSMVLDGIVNGWSIEMNGDYAAVNVSSDGGLVNLERNLNIRSWDTLGQSTLSVSGAASITVGANLSADIFNFETNTQTVANGTRAHHQMNFAMSAMPQSASPVLFTKSFYRDGDLFVHGDESVDGSNLGQVWPLAESLIAVDGMWWNGGEMIDDDPADGIEYILHQDANTISVEIVAALQGDTDGDGDVDVNDLLRMIEQFGESCHGANPVQRYCPSDVNRDGSTNVNDLLLGIANFGA